MRVANISNAVEISIFLPLKQVLTVLCSAVPITNHSFMSCLYYVFQFICRSLHDSTWMFFSCTFLLPFAFWAMFHRTSSHFDLVTSCLFAFLIGLSILIISGYKQSHTNFGLMAVCHPCSIEQNSNMHTASFIEEALGSSSIMSSCCSCVGFDISSVATSFATQKILFIWQEKSRSKIGGGILGVWQMILASILEDKSTL